MPARPLPTFATDLEDETEIRLTAPISLRLPAYVRDYFEQRIGPEGFASLEDGVLQVLCDYVDQKQCTEAPWEETPELTKMLDEAEAEESLPFDIEDFRRELGIR